MKTSYVKPYSPPKLYLNPEISYASNQQCYHSNYNSEFQRKLTELSNKLENNNETISMSSKQLNEVLQYPFLTILKMLPSNYPVQSVYVNGKNESVTNFLSINIQDKLVFFLDHEDVKTFECSAIDGIAWGEK